MHVEKSFTKAAVVLMLVEEYAKTFAPYCEFDWVTEHAIGRRHMTAAQLSDLRGGIYNRQKGSRGKKYQSETSTADRVAAMTDTSRATIMRDAQFNAAVSKLSRNHKMSRQREFFASTRSTTVGRTVTPSGCGILTPSRASIGRYLSARTETPMLLH